MRYALLLAMLLPSLSLFGAESKKIAEFGFEQSVKPGFIWKNRTGKVWFAPHKDLIWDFSGKNAHSGKGALGLVRKASICMDAHGFLEAGKTYELSVWVKPEKLYLPFSLNFIWFGKDGKTIQRNTRDLKLRDTAWQKISLTAKAPGEYRNVYFILHGGDRDAAVYIDDLQITEVQELNGKEQQDGSKTVDRK